MLSGIDAGASLQGRPTTGRLGVHDDADRGHARGFRKLFRKLQASLNAQAGRLRGFLAKLPSNQAGLSDPGALVLAHSLAGLITLHVVEARPELFFNVLAVHQKLLTARVNFFFRTSFALPPEYSFCFVDEHTGEPYPVDFLDAMSWVCRRLCPFLETPLLPLPPLRGKTFSLTPGE
ncbi:hypothetical protein NHJ6243_008556 [Beauveria neobassiana]